MSKTICSLLFVSYALISFVRFIYPAQFLLSFLLIFAGLSSLGLVSLRFTPRLASSYFVMLVLILSFCLSSLLVSRYERIGHVIMFILTSSGIAMIMVRRQVYSWAGYAIYYPIAAYFIIKIMSGASPDNVLPCSHNGVSMLMLVATICYYVVLYAERKKTDIWPALLTLIISIWGIGRSGVLSSMLILFGLLVMKYGQKRKYVYAIMFIGVILFIYQLSNRLEFIDSGLYYGNAYNKFIAMGAQKGPEVRVNIWENYFYNLNAFRVLFGANILTDPWPEGESLAFDYHNSFIHLHSQTGIYGLFLMALAFISLIYYYQVNQLLLFLFGALIVRWSTDMGMFFESWDFLFYYFIFNYMYCAWRPREMVDNCDVSMA